MAHLWVTGEAITAPLLNDMERRNSGDARKRNGNRTLHN